MGHGCSHVLRRSYYAHGRSAFDQEYFLAANLQTGTGIYRLPGYCSDEHLHRGGTSRGIRCGAAMVRGAKGGGGAAGSLRSSTDRRGRSKDGLLLAAGAKTPLVISIAGRGAKTPLLPAKTQRSVVIARLGFRRFVLEGKDRPEPIAPVGGLPGRATLEWQVIECDAGRPVIVSRVGNDIADFVDKSYPVIEFVGEGSRIQVGAAQVVAMLGIRVIGTIGGVRGVKYPAGIVAFWIRVEDPGKWEAQLSESPSSTDGLKIGGGNRGTRAS